MKAAKQTITEPKAMRDDYMRPIMVHVCRDGTVTFRRRDEPVFNGRALPVFSVNTPEEAEAIQVRFCRAQWKAHPLMPGKTWYRLSCLYDGTDPAHRGDGMIEPEDLDGITVMFREFWAEETKRMVQATLRASAIERKEVHHCERCGDRLDNEKSVWLELNSHTGRYAEAGTVPEAESQGCFAFGSACARAVLKAGGENNKIKGHR